MRPCFSIPSLHRHPIMKFKLNRDLTIVSRFGHAVAFVKGEETHVPAEMAHEVIALGAVAVEGDVQFADQTVKASTEPNSPVERTDLIKLALADIEARGNRDDFGSTGTPKVKVVEALLKFDVTGKEIGELWSAHLQAKDAK